MCPTMRRLQLLLTAFSEEAGHTPLLTYDVSHLDAPFALAPVSED